MPLPEGLIEDTSPVSEEDAPFWWDDASKTVQRGWFRPGGMRVKPAEGYALYYMPTLDAFGVTKQYDRTKKMQVTVLLRNAVEEKRFHDIVYGGEWRNAFDTESVEEV